MRRIVFAAVPPIQIIDLTAPFEIFARCGGYRVELCSNQNCISSSCGLKIECAKHYRRLRGDVDTLLVPGGDGAEELNCDDRFLQWLKRMSRRVRRIGSICTGAYLLAGAGILDGRRAVTHWRYCADLARSFPKVQVETEPIFVKDGHVYTSAGITAGIDMALALVEEDHGSQRALEIARDLVVFLRRKGGQAQFSTLLAAQTSARRPIEDLQAWIFDHPGEELSVETLATRCGMSPRHFARVFTKESGMTPGRFVESARVQRARILLEGSQDSIKEVAARAGFGSVDSMRRSFTRLLGVSAGEYAERFLLDGSRAASAP